MPTLLTMPRPRSEQTESVRVSSLMVKKIRYLAAHEDLTVPVWITQRLMPIVEREFAKMAAEIQNADKQPKPPKPQPGARD